MKANFIKIRSACQGNPGVIFFQEVGDRQVHDSFFSHFLVDKSADERYSIKGD
jgi:hypothetical protein